MRGTPIVLVHGAWHGGWEAAMSARAGRVHRLASSHSPFLSMPDAVADIILAV
jgi:hypothetical protein